MSSTSRASGDPGHAAEPPGTAPRRPRRGISAAAIRVVFAIVGVVSLAIGIVGLFVPLVPTTVFLLVAAACFARSSERLHRWLLRQPMLGPVITTWQRSRAFPPGVKRRALIAIAVTFVISIVLVDAVLLRVGLAIVGLTLGILLSRIPTEAPVQEPSPAADPASAADPAIEPAAG